jgi:hypothetical protein
LTQPYSALIYAIRAGAALMLVAASLSTMPAFAGSYLTRCSGGGEGNGVSVASSAPPSAPGCTSVALPVEAAQILAAVPAPRGRPGAPVPETVTITGVRDADTFLMREISVTPVSLTAAPPYLIPGSDLRAVAGVRGFGPLGRAAIETDDDQIVMTCEPGSDPAGLTFATARVPPIPGMTLRVVHSADSSFRLVVSDPSADAQGSMLLAKLKPADSATEAHVPLTQALPADTPLDFKILCPANGGHLQLNEIVLEAKSMASTARTTWIPDARLWQADPAWIFARAQRWGLTRLYIAIPTDEHGPKDLQALAGFIAEANSRGIEVWALLADGAAGANAQALADYNVAVPGAAQIKGAVVEFSAERRWTYFPDPGAQAQQFLDRMNGLKSVLGTPLEAIVPAWFPTDAVLAERYAAALDGLIVLTDRTEPDGIRKAVTRFLAWGTRRGKPVEVALEIAPMSATERARFARAESGELWLIPVGSERVLLLLKEPASDLPGVGFQQQESAEVAAEARTFADRRAELRQGLDSLGRTLGAWPSFAGFAFHDLFKEEN